MDWTGPLIPATQVREPPAAIATERRRDCYVLTCEPARVDLDQVHAWLSQESYWAKGRERGVVEESIRGSRPYSVFAGQRQVAFARVVTDGATFAWIGDVFVDEDHRGKGLGTWLVQSIVTDLEDVGVRRFLLATRDAHEVYRRCGFTALEGVERWMEIDQRPTRGAKSSSSVVVLG
jgi:GNAT superfamily N-acetyltransferase